MAVATALTLAACEPAAGPRPTAPAAPSSAERGYAPPPELTSASRLPDGRLRLSGTAPPGARVRLATPSGVAILDKAGVNGAWQIEIPPAAEVRLFGLSAATADRTRQAEGYLAVAPNGEAAQLRSGSGARVLVRTGARIAVLAADFDRKGGTVVSGLAPSGAPVTILIDGRPLAPIRARRDGRFLMALNEPLKVGTHSILAVAGGAQAEESLVVSPPPMLVSGPFQATTVDGGWRIDWLTPGGGVQATVLYGPHA